MIEILDSVRGYDDPLVLCVVAMVVGYLIGAVSFARIIGSRVIPGEDLDNLKIPIEKTGRDFRMAAVSATVIRMKAGPKWGCLTSILDMVKATLPVLALRLLFPGSPCYLYAAAAAVVGHNFPIYYRFKGGRGISPIYGGLFVIDWLAIPVATAAGSFFSLLVLRYAFVTYFGVTLAMIPWFWFRFGDIHHMAYALVVNVSFWLASVPEVREYIRHSHSGHFRTGYHFVGAGQISEGLISRWIARRREARASVQTESPGPTAEEEEPTE